MVIYIFLCAFIDFILKFREIFPWRETVLWAHRMKSDENQFFCQIHAIFVFVFFFLKKKLYILWFI